MKKEQKNSSNLFNDEMLNKKINLTSIQGGGKNNKSDSWFGGHTDSKQANGSYDIVVNSVKDIETTTCLNDNPDFVSSTINP